ncbi:hypothetical protein RRG08_008371 [Elysia crispata]|uniref:EF-hand domain-containing protein n=1 Tax=Elysia crispata TaxID=231223 RepID=A0AAE1AZK7_9GAST|nr:hypothetical protein RRG08_008371 [Elysia crispata]
MQGVSRHLQTGRSNVKVKVGHFPEISKKLSSLLTEKARGFISAAEMRHLLTAMGERLEDEEVDEIIKHTDITIDLEGNVKYNDFINKVIAGPPMK